MMGYDYLGKLKTWTEYRAKILKMKDEGLSVNEIAKLELKSPQTVNTLLKKARRDREGGVQK